MFNENGLVTLAEAQRRLRNGDVDPVDLKALIAEATDTVLEHIANRRSDDGSPSWADQMAAWDSSTVPPRIKGAILKMVLYLEKFRGGDVDVPPQEKGYLPTDIEALLMPYRDPTIS